MTKVSLALFFAALFVLTTSAFAAKPLPKGAAGKKSAPSPAEKVESAPGKSTVLHEGWYTVTLAGQKVGYFTEKYEFTPEGKFKATTYLKTNAIGGNLTQSLKAFSKSDLTPLNYAYTSKIENDIKVIDATFKSDTMNLRIIENGKESKRSAKIKKGTFLSTFLLYLILQQKNGLSIGKDYAYSGIAEEDGTISTGSAYIKSLDKVDGQESFKILNEFKGQKFFSWVTPRGTILMTRMPAESLEVKIAANKADATKNMMVNERELSLLFGSSSNEPGAAADKAAEKKAEEGMNLKAGAAKPEASASPAVTEQPDKKISDDKKKKLFKPGKPQKGMKGDSVPAGQGVEIKGVKPSKDGEAQE